MPIDIDEVPDPPKKEYQAATTANGNPNGDGGKWANLFTPHPESGGFFGGRNHALSNLVWFLRAKRFPFEEALRYSHDWNNSYCTPPIEEFVVAEMVSRMWVEWQIAEIEDATPEKAGKSKDDAGWEVLTSDELLDLEESGGGMQWLVPDILVQGGLHYLTAAPGIVKSWLLLDLSRCVSGGFPWFQRFDVAQGHVIYVDEEMGKANVSDRIQKLAFERGLPFTYLGKQEFRIFDASDRKRLVKLILEKEARLVCFDTMAAIWPGLKENDASEVTMLRAYFKEIAATGATIVVACHDRKSGVGEEGSKQNRQAGSRDFTAMADFTYGIDKKNGYFHIEFAKNRHLPDDKALSMDFAVTDTPEGKVVVHSLSDEEVSDAACMVREKKIVSVLREEGPLSTTDLCAKITGSPNATLTILGRMVDKGMAVMSKDGLKKTYSLSE